MVVPVEDPKGETSDLGQVIGEGERQNIDLTARIELNAVVVSVSHVQVLVAIEIGRLRILHEDSRRADGSSQSSYDVHRGIPLSGGTERRLRSRYVIDNESERCATENRVFYLVGRSWWLWMVLQRGKRSFVRPILLKRDGVKYLRHVRA